MKKSLFLIASALMLVVFSTVCLAAFERDTVEISFKVGDSTLDINGTPVSVETPYVTPDGVTLVPVRVITEAFGSQVDWDGNEKRVTLTSLDMTVKLWIGKEAAELNGKELVLLSAPTLTNDVTMVPLRFISESFGALVSYDDNTRAIKVFLDRGDKVTDGAKYFDDGFLGIRVPEDYALESGKDGKYVFYKTAKHNYSDFDTVHGYEFSVPALENPKEVLENDRNNQKQTVTAYGYIVSDVTEGEYNNTTVYSYSIMYKKKNSTSLRVKKTLRNVGDCSYFTLTLYNNYAGTQDEAFDEDGVLTAISLDYGDITLPGELACQKLPDAKKLYVTASAKPVICVDVFPKDENTDTAAFLEEHKASKLSIINPRNMYASRIRDFEIGTELCKGYTLTFMDESFTKYILAEREEYFVLVTVSDEADSSLPMLLSSLKVMSLGENSQAEDSKDVEVRAGNMAFSLPDSFDVIVSEDGKYLSAVDRESGLVMQYYPNTAVVANESYVIRTMMNHSNPFTGPQVYNIINDKSAVSDFASDFCNSLEKDGWTVSISRQKNNRRSNKLLNDYEDVIRAEKTTATNMCFYTKAVYCYIDNGEYEHVEDNERIKEVKKLLEDNESSRTVSDQEVHCFIFTYTSMFDEEKIDELCGSILSSLKTV